MKKKTTVYLIAVFGSILMGMTFLASKIALGGLEAIEVLACRWTLAFLLFAILVLLKVIRVDYKKKPVWMVLVMALVQPCINMFCETKGVDLTTTSESAIIYAMIPIAVVLISRIFLKQKVSLRVGLGIVVSFAGVVIAIAFSEGFSIGGKAAGYMLLLGMAVSGGLFIVISGRLSETFTTMERTFIMAGIASIWFNSLNLISGGGFDCYSVCFQDLRTGLAVLYLGLIGSFVCNIVMNYVVSNIPAAQASSIQINIISLTGVVTGILFQGDSFGWYTVVGMVMIVVGIIACNAERIKE